MACDTRLKPKQTISERATEVRKALASLEQALLARTIVPRMGPQGAVIFPGWSESSRDGVTDGCALRRLMTSGSDEVKKLLRGVEQQMGRSFDRTTRVHSHDGGRTWHKH